MAPKHALFSSSGSGGPEVGLNSEEETCRFSPSAWIPVDAGMVAACSPRNGTGTRALNGMLARWFVTICAVLMLMTQSSLAINGKTLNACLYTTLTGWMIVVYLNHKNTSRLSSAERSDSVSVKLA